MLQYHIILPIVPILLITILLEAILIQRSQKFRFAWRESVASLCVAVGHGISKLLFGVIPIGVYSFIWEHRLWTVSLDRGWTLLLLFVGLEFCYYWYHRLAHQVPWLWATHVVHHSTTRFNLSAAYRLGWTGWLSGNFLFFSPLVWLGFDPVAVATTLSINLLYQFWIHTELISKLGWLEWILNTPSHHRVHHAANPEYLGCNFGGVLIIFDRLFGTFTAEHLNCPLIYGLAHPLRSHNPIKIAFHEWSGLFQKLKVAKTWCNRCQMIIKRST
ncbi:MAG: sterol desaturase family protein [Cyanobacteria bacterium J06560_6]